MFNSRNFAVELTGKAVFYFLLPPVRSLKSCCNKLHSLNIYLPRVETICLNHVIYVLPPEQIFQPEPFRLDQISQARRNESWDEQQYIDRIHEKQIFSYFCQKHLIALQFFKECNLVSGLCFTVSVDWMASTWSLQG